MKKVLVALFVLIVLGAAGAGAFWLMRHRKVDAFAHQPFGEERARVVNVPPGTGPRSLSALLARERVVEDADRFYAVIRNKKAAPRLKAGEYEFKGALTPLQVLEKLTSGQVRMYRFTVPEGLRADEIVPILAASELKLDAVKLSRLMADKQFLQRSKVPPSPSGVEGFLYPDTYSFSRPFSEEAVVAKMIARALEEYAKADAERDPKVKLDLLQTMTLASIIEKETGAVEERRRISCVFHNRLAKRIPLATDPTVLYAKMLVKGAFVKNITREDLKRDHPYNTYRVKGLPPGPIANAGAAAIHAALNPLVCNDLFFVSRNDGTHVFCPDLRCHEAAVQKWQVEYHRRRKRG